MTCSSSKTPGYFTLPCLCRHCCFCQESSLPLCLPSKHTYSSFKSQLKHYLFCKVSRSLPLDVHPGRILTVPSEYTYPSASPIRHTSSSTSLLSHGHSLLLPFPPQPSDSQEIYHNYLRIPSTSTLPFSISRRKEKREGGKEAKLESPVNSSQKYIPHLTEQCLNSPAASSLILATLIWTSATSPLPGLLLLILTYLVCPPYSCQGNLTEK